MKFESVISHKLGSRKGNVMSNKFKSRHLNILPIVIMAVLSQNGYSAEGPCDIYQSGGTPCVAAHSTTRALYGAYAGNLYQVRRASDNATKDIPVLTAGGFADVSVQDQYCSGTTCKVSKIYDQTSNHNDLVKSPKVYWLEPPRSDFDGGIEANAADGQIQISGHKVHGIAVNAWSKIAYRNNATKGIATGNQAEAMYMVVDGKRHSDQCCFDYGNAETTGLDDGNGTMEALYWGSDVMWGGYGQGSGPWVAADLENGMFKGNDGGFAWGDTHKTPWPTAQSVIANFATAMLKGPSDNTFALKAGDAQSGKLITMWNDVRPSNGYSPKTLQGAIILGTGGDGSPGGEGTFFEGAMTIGVPSDAIDDAIQANINAAGYGSATPIITVPAHRDTVFNGGFVQGTMGWTFNTWGGTAQGSVVNGEYKIDISALGTANSSIQLVQNGIILQQGKSYEVKFDAYASANRTLEANVELDVSPWTSYLPALKSFDISTTKSTYSYTFTMTNATDSNGRISFNAGASKTGLFLDNVSIKEVPTPVSIGGISGQSVFASVINEGSRLKVTFSGAQGGTFSLGLYDLAGKPVRMASLRNDMQKQLSWNPDISTLAAGIYLVKISNNTTKIYSSKIFIGR